MQACAHTSEEDYADFQQKHIKAHVGVCQATQVLQVENCVAVHPEDTFCCPLCVLIHHSFAFRKGKPGLSVLSRSVSYQHQHQVYYSLLTAHTTTTM